jgi:hypothetical protein
MMTLAGEGSADKAIPEHVVLRFGRLRAVPSLCAAINAVLGGTSLQNFIWR